MALNNLGAAEIGLGEMDAAKVHLEEALAEDPQSPLPVFNLAVWHRKMGLDADASFWLLRSRQLGYSASTIDRLVRSSQTRFAALDGAGTS